MTTDFTLDSVYMAALLAPLDGLADGACVRADPRLFDGDRPTREQVTAAQQWCDECPVAQTCLDGAKTRGEFGVWGGRVLVKGRDVTPESLRGTA